MKEQINYFNIISITISVIAVFIAYLSFETSKIALEYQISKDSIESTPSLTETKDSLKIEYGLSNNSELQILQIIFQHKVHSPIKIITKPVQIRKSIIEEIANDYLISQVSIKDSVRKEGTLSLPVMIEYSAIINGSSQEYRENRFLLFNFYQTDGKDFNIEYSNSFLNSRFGFPIKGHYFWKMPFTKLSQERISNQDSIDVQELLSNQLEFLNKDLK